MGFKTIAFLKREKAVENSIERQPDHPGVIESRHI
jgi:hypothetical protein